MDVNKVLITGANGFVGGYFINHLSDCSVEIVKFPETIDIRDKEKVNNFFINNSFNAVVHLAAQSFVPRSFINPKETYEINFTGTLNILEALRLSKFRGVFLYIGSSDVYGIVPESSLPIMENVALSPMNPYAESKVAAELLCKEWSISEDIMRIVMTRSFNHIGPLQEEKFVISGFCKQVAMIKNGLQEPYIETGNLNVTRDFTDVRDVVRAYKLLLEKGINGEVYNVCSGREVLLKDVLLKLRQLTNIDFDVNVSSDLYRDVEQSRVLGDLNKINKATSWTPRILFDKSIIDIFRYWVEKTKKENL